MDIHTDFSEGHPPFVGGTDRGPAPEPRPRKQLRTALAHGSGDPRGAQPRGDTASGFASPDETRYPAVGGCDFLNLERVSWFLRRVGTRGGAA